MKKGIVDLHVHSTKSDGTFSVADLVSYACEKGLDAFALTDHDTFAGIEEALEAAKGTELEVIPGIEFSTVHRDSDVHIVGLDIDYKHPLLQEHMDSFMRSRTRRNEMMVERMQADGFRISMEMLGEEFPDTVITRAHIARHLLEAGYVDTMKEAFEKYIGEGKPYYVKREKITPHQVVRLIAATGGIPVFAHPMLCSLSMEDLRLLIEELKEEGLIGIEAIYSTYSEDEELCVRQLAEEYSLAISGGSDFHGSNKPNLDLACGYGNLCIPVSVLDNLRLTRRRKND